MFSGFTDETIQFFLDLKFHNNTAYFHSNHERYTENVQYPFYEFINDLAPAMLEIDPKMEVRPYKCLSRIHRDTRFSRDKSPYRDHHWLLFRRQAEPREKSIMYYFEFGPDRLGWGMGVWGENRELFDILRKRMLADPQEIQSLFDNQELRKRKLLLNGSFFRRMEVPPQLPPGLQQLYRVKEMYISRINPVYRNAFSEKILKDVRKDFIVLSPLYKMLRGYADELRTKEGE